MRTLCLTLVIVAGGSGSSARSRSTIRPRPKRVDDLTGALRPTFFAPGIGHANTDIATAI